MGVTTPGAGRVPPLSRGSLSSLVTLALVVAIAGQATAESWTLLWSENFADVSDWTLEGHWTTTGAGGSPPDSLVVIPGAQTGTQLGPTYRSAGGSLWDDSTNNVVRIELDNILFPDLGGGADNRQLTWVLADSGANHVPDQADAIQDWMEIRLMDAPCCGVIAWRVVVKDDGVQQANQDFTIPQFQDVDGAFPAMFANITLNTVLSRFWINWSFPGNSGAHTGTWTGDGPFAETNSVRVNLWGYSTQFGLYIDNMALYGNQTFVPPPPPPPPPPPRKRIHADFGYAISELGTQFYDRSNGPGKMVAWKWSFGDGYGSSREFPFHTFMCRGNFTVVLEVEDEYGNQGKVSAQVRMNATHPLCGIVTRGEEGVKVLVGNQQLDVPTGVFIGIAAISATSLALGIDIPYFPRSLRLFLLFLSAVGLFITLGLLGEIFGMLGA